MPAHKHTFQAIGTHWEIVTDRPLPESLYRTIRDRIDLFDRAYSRFRADSLVSRIAQQAGEYELPGDSVPLMNIYENLYNLTDGQFSLLIGGALESAGYDSSYSFNPKPQEPVPKWETVLRRADTELVTTQPVTLDFGAAGKGYLVDLIAELLQRAEVENFTIDASGDIRIVGKHTETIGLEHPHDASRVVGRVSLHNQSLCSSATNRRAWAGDMHHIFDPVRSEPVRNIVATWAIADTTLVADAVATALFFSEPSVLLSQYSFRYIRMHQDGSVDYSQDLEGALYR